MSLNHKKELIEVAKLVCRQLRANSTEAEKLFWEAVRNNKFENRKFYRQHPFIYDLTGIESFFVSDFYCHQDRLIIELDGNIHKYRLNDDEKRMKILNLLGVKVLRFHNEEIINNLDRVLMLIKREFINGTHPPAPSLAKEKE
jgi:very-short-patch-repair endonuclease